MKLKTISTIGLCVGIIGIAAIIAPYIITYCFSAEEVEGIGIIGGADGPTAKFLTFQLFINRKFLPLSIFLALTVISAFYLIFNKTATNGCTLKTTALSVGMSVSIAASIYGLFNLYFFTVFGGSSRSPIRFPLSQALGLIFPIIFVIILIFYCLARKAKPSVGETLLDIITTLLLVVPFTSFLLFMDNLLLLC